MSRASAELLFAHCMITLHPRAALLAPILVAALATSLAACSRCAPTDAAATRPAPAPEHLAAGRASVERLFRAVAERDCTTTRELLLRIDSEEACTELFHEWEEHDMTLVEILGVTADGRDRSAVIVRTRLRRAGSVAETLIRATPRADGWTVGL